MIIMVVVRIITGLLRKSRQSTRPTPYDEPPGARYRYNDGPPLSRHDERRLRREYRRY